MKSDHLIFSTLFMLLLMAACVSEKDIKQVGEIKSPEYSTHSTEDSTIKESEYEPVPEDYFDADYLLNRDLDGDGKNDGIYFNYTGGAHCCYLMTLVLSSQKDTLAYPFEMDGGYMGGVDGSYPEKFRIEDIDEDGIEEIIMTMYTYNGIASPIEEEWKTEYGISGNHILFDFHGEEMTVEDRLPLESKAHY